MVIQRLKQITKGLLSHVNVICLNPNGGSLKATTKQEAIEFVNKLNEAGVSATLRRSQGSDIEGACGMLRNKELKDNKIVEKTRNNIKIMLFFVVNIANYVLNNII